MNTLNRNRFSQFTFIFAGLLLLFGAASGHAQGRGGKENKEIRLQVFITGIPGDGDGGAIEAFGSDQVVSNTGTIGGGGGAGKAEFGPLVITKGVDRASTLLLKACATGMHIARVQVNWIRGNPNNKQEEVFFMVMIEDVIISRVQSGLPNQNDSFPTETVSLNFDKIRWTYFLPDGTQVKGGFDVSGNKPL